MTVIIFVEYKLSTVRLYSLVKSTRYGYEVAGTTLLQAYLRGCIQKFRDCPPGAITENGTALCH